MNCKTTNSRNNRIFSTLRSTLALALLSFGCTPLPTEVDPIDVFDPIDCNDLLLNPLSINEIPYPQEDFDTIHADAPFKIQWLARFVRGQDMNHFGYTGEYIARVTILKDGVIVLSADIDATPLNVDSAAYDDLFVENGLPAGTYIVRVVLDPLGQVEQCSTLALVLNNVREAELVIESDPIDDLADPLHVPERQSLGAQ